MPVKTGTYWAHGGVHCGSRSVDFTNDHRGPRPEDLGRAKPGGGRTSRFTLRAVMKEEVGDAV
jgi:hypothetical protein